MSSFQRTICFGPYAIELEAEIEYNEGYFQEGCRSGHPDNWTPDEGENPEILAVYALRADGRRSKDILAKLSKDTIRDLQNDAWKHQVDRAADAQADYEPDYDRDDY